MEMEKQDSEKIKYRKMISFLGICAKAGHVQSGSFCVENAIKGKKACLVICAEDASQGTVKTFKDMCSYRAIPFTMGPVKNELGHCIGKEDRSVIAIMDEKMAEAVMDLL